MGVFQLESGPMRQLLRALAPTDFGDVAAVLALYRPGPMGERMHLDYAARKNGRQDVSYIHPDAEEVLADTYGLMIYQESVMRMSQRFAGYSLADADNLRKACGKKIRELMAKERAKFVDGCETTGYGRDLGTRLFDTIEGFADYAFAKSHAFGYGLITYQTAYLKAHHPVEYLACLLTSVKASLEKAAVYLADCRAMGIKVLPPDVNLSASEFTALPVEQAPPGVELPPRCRGLIPFGLSAVRNVGEGLVSLIVDERDRSGPFVSFYDFVERVDPSVLNKRSVESLIKGGAFDTLGHPRKGLLQVFEQIIDATLQRRRERDQGVMSLFEDAGSAGGSFDERVAIPAVEFDKAPRLRFEKEMLGLYVSDHPLMGVEGSLRRRTDGTIAELEERADGDVLTVGGVVTGLQRKFTKKGDAMGVFVLEDLQDAVEVTLFPRVMQEQGYKLVDDAIVIVRARVDRRDDAPKLIGMDITPFEGFGDAAPPLRVHLPASALSDERIGRLKTVLAEHPGESPVFLHLGEGKVLRLPDQHRVDLTRVVGDLRVAFGHDSVVL
jgi:DNA polymerase-3 subunit alpha